MNQFVGNWLLQASNQIEMKYMKSLFLFVYNFCEEIFGKEIMTNEPCLVFNDPNSVCPMLITNSNPILIRTNATELCYWCQYIFQLSHELTHYAIRQQKVDKELYINWFEETLCEAMFLYILNISVSRWDECLLYDINPNYSSSIKEYFENVYQEQADSVLQKCRTNADLQEVEKNCTKNREGRTLEQNNIFNLFVQMPNDIKNIIYYTQYVRLNGIELDFERWEATNFNTNSCFISRLKTVQPIFST